MMKPPGHFLQSIARLVSKGPSAGRDGLRQNQREAIIDAMLYSLFADEFDDPVERRVLDREVARIDWESEVSVDDYIRSASERVKAAVASPESEEQFLKDISLRLENWETRFNVLQLCKILFYSDLFFSDEEVRALAQMKRVFRR